MTPEVRPTHAQLVHQHALGEQLDAAFVDWEQQVRASAAGSGLVSSSSQGFFVGFSHSGRRAHVWVSSAQEERLSLYELKAMKSIALVSWRAMWMQDVAEHTQLKGHQHPSLDSTVDILETDEYDEH